jgi:hyperosmotically inducible protein
MRRNSVLLRLPAVLAFGALIGVSSANAQTADPPQSTSEQAKEAARQSGNVIKDSWITMKVHSQFIPEDALEGSDIDVETNAGVVTLRGTVVTEAGRARAVAIAKATDGVKSVKDDLKIGRAEGDAREAGERAGEAARGTTGSATRAVTDGWLKSKIYSQFLTEDALDDSDIDIDITKGAVTLNGSVKTEAGRERAAAIAKDTEGVKSVKNNLKVQPKDG